MSLHGGHARLQRAADDLAARWRQTRLLWRDDNARRFEEDLLRPMLARLRTTEKALGHMDEVLYKIRRDCT